MLLSPATLASMALGFVAAYPACGFFAFMPNGLAEAAVMVTVFFAAHRILTGSIKMVSNCLSVSMCARVCVSVDVCRCVCLSVCVCGCVCGLCLYVT